MFDAAVGALVSRWEAHRDAGTPISPEELCRDHPECLNAVKQRIAALRAVAPIESLDTVDCPGTTPALARPTVVIPKVPGYDLLDVLARGGMGVVFRAREHELKRSVAIKMLRAEISALPHHQARFRREAELLAGLRHDHIVPVYTAALHQGQPYFVMELVEGGNLAGHLPRFRADPRAAVSLMEKVARAVHHAHDQGVLHRDLKPANILLGPGDKPLVSDFGLAKLLAAEAEDAAPPGRTPGDGAATPRLTRTGAGPGTPAYMAPEQFGGATVGPPTDVWALGIILYELLAGRYPFPGEVLADLAYQIRTQPPAPPRAVNPRLAPALEAIILRCLAKDPGLRYAKAGALAEDLARWLRGDLDPWHRRFWRRARGPVLVALAASLVTGTLFFLSGGPPLVMEPGAAGPPTPTEREEAAYQAEVKAIHQDLRQGREVEMILPDGRPRAGIWRAGREPGMIRPVQRGDDPAPVLQVDTKYLGLFELLQAPPLDRYQIIAELRHDRSSSPFGTVGIFFGRHAVRDPRQAHQQRHFQHVLSFCDSGQNSEAIPHPDTGQKGSRLLLNLLHFASQGPGALVSKKHTDMGPEGWYTPPPRGTVAYPWRRLEITVSPIQSLVRMEGVAALGVDATLLEDYLQRAGPNHPDIPDLRPLIAPRGDVGIYSLGDAVSVRRFRIVPLQNAP